MDWKTPLKALYAESYVVQCDPTTPVRKVRAILQSSDIGSVVISSEGRVVGIFTERDYLLKIAGEEKTWNDAPISDCMTKDPKQLDWDSSVIDALNLMKKGGFRHVVVVDENAQVRMMLSIKDVLMHMLNTMDDVEDSLRDLVACIA